MSYLSDTLGLPEIYTINSYTMFEQGRSEFRFGNDFYIIFGNKEGKMYVILAEYVRGKPSRSNGRWHGNPGKFHVYLRKNFFSREQGNDCYKKFKKFLGNPKPMIPASDDGQTSYYITKFVDVREVIRTIGF